MRKVVIPLILLFSFSIFADEQTDWQIVRGLVRDGAYSVAVSRLESFLEQYPETDSVKKTTAMLVEASLAGNMFEKVHKYSKQYKEQFCGNQNLGCFKVSLYNAYAFYFEKDLANAELALKEIEAQVKEIDGKLKVEYERLSGDVAFERNRFQDAKNHYNNFLKQTMDNEIRLKLGMSYYHLKKYSKADRILSKLEKEKYKNNLLYRYLGLIAFGKDKYEKALLYFNNSNDRIDRFFSVHTLVKLQRLEDGFTLYRELVPVPEISEQDLSVHSFSKLIDMRMLSKAREVAISISGNENSESEYLLFEFYDLLKNYEEAVSHLKKYAYLSKNSYKGFYKVAEYYLTRLNDMEKADEFYQKVIDTENDGKLSSVALLNRIKCSLYMGKKENTLSLTTEFLKEYGVSSKITDEVYFILGKLMLDRGKYEEAVKSFENIVTNYPESSLNDNAIYFLCEAYFRTGMYKDAVLAAKKYNGKRFKANTLYNIAMGSYLVADFEECIDANQKLMELDPKMVDKKTYSYAYAFSGDLTSALKVADRDNSIKFISFVLGEEVKKAVSFVIDEKIPSAERLYDACFLAETIEQKELMLLKCVENSEKSSVISKLALQELDVVIEETKDFISLMELNSEYVKNDPEGFHGSQGILKKARKYREKGKLSKALSLYKMAVNSYPNAPSLDEAYYFLFEYSKPVKYQYLKKIVDSYKEGEYFPLASYKLAMQNFKDKDYENCIPYFENVVNSEEESLVKLKFIVHYYLGIAYEKTGDIENAIESYRRYLKLVPDDVKQYQDKTRIALLFQKNEFFDEALSVLEKIKPKVKNHNLIAEITYYIAECYEGKNDLEKALENYLSVTYLHTEELMWSTTARFKAASICEKLEYYDDAIKLYSKIASAYKGQVQGKFAAKKVEELKNK